MSFGRIRAALERALLAGALLCAPVAPATVAAQEPSPARGRFEVAGHLGVRAGGLVRVPDTELPLDVEDAGTRGAEITWLPSPALGVGLLVSHQSTRMIEQSEDRSVASVILRIEHVALQLRPGSGTVRPVLGASLGRTVFTLASGGDGEAHPSGSVSIGALVGLGSRLDLLTRARFIATVLGGSGRILCGPRGPCYQTTNDTVLLQLQLVGGLAVRF